MSIRSRLIGAFSVSLLALIAVGCAYKQSLDQLVEARRWVDHTMIVLERLETAVSLCKDIETGERGFCLTHKEVFLEPYNRGLSQLPGVMAEIGSLTSDNPNEQRRLHHLEDLETSKIAFSQRAVQLARTQSTSAAADLTAAGQGKKVMDEIRAVVSEAEDEERSLLAKRTEDADRLMSIISNGTILGAILAVLVTGIAACQAISVFSRSIGKLQDGLDKIGQGHLDHKISTDSNDEFSRLGLSFNDMATKLKATQQESSNQSWLNTGLARLGQMLQGERDLPSAGQKILSEFASAIGSRHGLLYVLKAEDGTAELDLLSSYAHHQPNSVAQSFAIGQGLVGQCALEKQTILVSNVPDEYFRISSGSGQASPMNLAVVPVVFEDKVKAVIEQASFQPFDSVQLLYLEQAANNLGVILNSIEAAQHTEQLLLQEQTLTEELQSQQEELTETNTRLEGLAESLQSSEEELRQQQEELQQTNEELEERTRIQAKQNTELEGKNIELEQLRRSMQEKAEQLSVSSKYKSEFLSNMSHELRTPLNSLLILSKVLVGNAEGNLTEKQVEYARTINSAGSDLLSLIDDILDISKIEAGAMSIDVAEEPLRELCGTLVANFDALAKGKGLSLTVEVQPQMPRFIKTDGRRLMQILKNILSNAVKFTEKGTVALKVEPATDGWSRDNQVLNGAQTVVAFTVVDTGIGIPTEKQSIIFEAFQQADGTTHRKFGGSGLGLAISREITRLLGGEIRLKSEEGRGSTFTLYLPLEYEGALNNGAKSAPAEVVSSHKETPLETSTLAALASDSAASDDRADIISGDKVLLVMQQDPEVAKQVIDLAHTRGFKVLCATQGKTAFALAQRFKPDAITLDVSLPDKDGWIFLDRLKRDVSTRHIPVHVISDEEHAHQARRLGAIGYSSKPASPQGLIEMINQLKDFVSRDERHLLIVEDNNDERQSLESLVEGSDVKTTAVATGQEAYDALTKGKYDCMILDLGLPDMSGFDLLNKIQNNSAFSEMRVIVHTSRSLTPQEETELRRNTEAIVVKGARSAERLLDETTLFLHRIETNLPEQKRKMLERLHLKDPLLAGRKILIVDDDMRHIFAVTSLLEQYNMQVKFAEDGKQALDVLTTTPGIELVLMDVMMPDMDGYEAMRAIRKLEQYRNLPIIALTAKAMKGDRDQCQAAGASDYLSKPVDNDQLLSLMRVWLY